MTRGYLIKKVKRRKIIETKLRFFGKIFVILR